METRTHSQLPSTMSRFIASVLLLLLIDLSAYSNAVTVVIPQRRQDGSFNMYGGDDASQIMQAAFAQAGISMGDGIAPMSFSSPTRKPSIFSAARLRNSLRLPSLTSFARRKVTPMPMLVPIMGRMPKPLKQDGNDDAQLMHQMNQQAASHNSYMTAPPLFFQSHHHNHNPQFVDQSNIVTPKPLETSITYHVWPTPGTSTPATPISSEHVKRLPVSLTRPRFVNHNYNENWSPSSAFSGFKPIDATPSASTPAVNISDYYQSTSQRVSFWDKQPSDSSISKSFAAWKSHNDSVAIDEMLKFHPSKTSGDNKIGLPTINPANLLAQINKDGRDGSRRSVDCKNKDLGWCDYTDNYPTHFVQAVIKECRDVIERMYVEVPQNLADFDDFVPFAPITNSSGQAGKERGSQATWSWAGYRSKSKALCDAERKFVRPSVAQDITGRWFIIVQSSLYHQQIPVELCQNPGGVCNNIGECGTHARCVQKFSTQLLISIDLDKENDCPSMRLYRFPSGCVCDAAFYQK